VAVVRWYVDIDCFLFVALHNDNTMVNTQSNERLSYINGIRDYQYGLLLIHHIGSIVSDDETIILI